MDEPQMERAVRMLMHLLPQKDLTLIILKGHLIIEEELLAVVSSAVVYPPAIAKARLSFHKLSYIAKALFFHPDDEWLWAGIGQLNLLRNELVHQLEAAKLEELVRKFLKPTETMMRRIKSGPTGTTVANRLRSALAFMYGALSSLPRRRAVRRAT